MAGRCPRTGVVLVNSSGGRQPWRHRGDRHLGRRPRPALPGGPRGHGERLLRAGRCPPLPHGRPGRPRRGRQLQIPRPCRPRVQGPRRAHRPRRGREGLGVAPRRGHELCTAHRDHARAARNGLRLHHARQHPLDPRELRDVAARTLLGAMVPTRLLHLQQLPLSGTGKADYAAVRVLLEQDAASVPDPAARPADASSPSAAHQLLAEIGELLGRPVHGTARGPLPRRAHLLGRGTPRVPDHLPHRSPHHGGRRVPAADPRQAVGLERRAGTIGGRRPRTAGRRPRRRASVAGSGTVLAVPRSSPRATPTM